MITDDMVIQLRNVYKTFDYSPDRKYNLKDFFVRPFQKAKVTKFEALKDISFEVKAGEFFGIVGKNGSGKSTLLKLIAGIYAPNKGTVVTKGKLIPFIELGVGFNPELSAVENIFLNGTILGLKKKYLLKNMHSILEFAGLTEFASMQLKHFSSGMVVRLAFSIAIQADGDIYIMDEVLSVGDFEFQKKCIDKLEEIIKAGKTVVFVSHDTSSIQKYCSRVLYIKDHVIDSVGDPKTITEKYLNS